MQFIVLPPRQIPDRKRIHGTQPQRDRARPQWVKVDRLLAFQWLAL